MVTNPLPNSLLYISGGARSGKSLYAEQRALALAGPRSYIATCPVLDDEMAARIDRHQQRRADQGWQTIEEPVDLVAALEVTHDSRVVLVDCVTLWINNLLYAAGTEHQTLDEDTIHRLTLQVIDAARQGERTVILVSNELGMGIVRRMPCLATTATWSVVAIKPWPAHADEAVLMVSGLPLALK